MWHSISEMARSYYNMENRLAFPIVGIGASAGGLDALETFLRHVPNCSGISFVIVQHLDSMNKEMMPELLQRVTEMEVIQVKDSMKVNPDCVYVIPPNKDMYILQGVLHLIEPIIVHGLRLSIDFFFQSVAEDQKERSIAVILSGMGTDGTLGIKKIKEMAGLVLVQEPSDSKFDSMPLSAIDTGIVDIIAKAEELPGKIVTFLQHSFFLSTPKTKIAEEESNPLEKIMLLLREQTGHDFSLYKTNTVYRRVERRMSIQQIDKLTDYVKYLEENPQELEILFKELLIGVTNFFRDPSVWEELKINITTKIIDSYPSGQILRAWTPGCSTGEEAYSLAIIFKEVLEKMNPKSALSLQIFATDLDKDAIDRARQGIYPANIVADVSPERLKRFFIKEENSYRICKEIREMIVFAPQNIIMDPPFSKLDILTCRNLLIYFDSELQKKLIPLFHFSLNTGGILMLGNSETIGRFTDIFAQIGHKSRIYRCIESVTETKYFEVPASPFSSMFKTEEKPKTQKEVISIQSLIDQIILKQHSPATILVNDKGDILYINGRTGKYLEPAAGKVNWNIFAMAREGLKYELTEAFWKALRQKSIIKIKNVKIKGSKSIHAINLTVQYIQEPVALYGMIMIIFNDTEEIPVSHITGKNKGYTSLYSRLLQLEQDLLQSRGELQITREGIQTSHEELKSANEELQSTNEERQSTIEELTTSKEELQSLNEELHTSNIELQSKLEDLSRTDTDMKNLLNSTEIATVFLDNNLNLRRYTTQATNIIKFIPKDIGRPITDISTDLIYCNMSETVREVINSQKSIENQIPTHDGRWFLIRIMPYCTLENTTDGVVITFLDITIAKMLELNLLTKERLYLGKNEESPIGIAQFDCDGKLVDANSTCFSILGIANTVYINNTKLFDLLNITEQNSNILHRYETVEYEILYDRNTSIQNELYTNTKQGNIFLCIQITPLFSENKTLNGYLARIQDISWGKQNEKIVENNYELQQRILENIATPIFSLDNNCCYMSFNKSHKKQMKGIFDAEIQIGKNYLDYIPNTIDRQNAKDNIARALKGESHFNSIYCNYKLLYPRLYKIFYNPLRGRDGSITGAMVFEIDISEKQFAVDDYANPM